MTLVEVLIGMTIMSLITAMILVSWFALNNAYSYSVSSSKARDNAREAIARLEREIRDAESPSTGTGAALSLAESRTIVIWTTFNVAGNGSPLTTPHMVKYELRDNGELWRLFDVDGDNEITGNEGARMLVKDTVNGEVPSAEDPTSLFNYSYYRADGTLVQDTTVDDTTTVDGAAAELRRVVSVTIDLLVDLNPAHSPIYTEFKTTAQLRNQR